MRRYLDPLDTIFVDPPPGWALDRYSSQLTSLVFLPWNRPDESLHVVVHPPDVPSEAPLEAWLERVAQGLPPGTALKRLPCDEGMTVAATLHEAHGITRVAFVRGLRLVAMVEHRGAGDDPEATALLARAVASLLIPPNRHLPPPPPRERIAELQAECRAAMQRGDGAAAVAALENSRAAATALWLASLTGGSLPDLDAAESAATALIGLGAIARVPGPVREGEEILLRLRRFVPRLPLSPGEARQWDERCAQMLARCVALQRDLVGLDNQAPGPIQLLDARALFLLREALAAAEKRALDAAARTAAVALDDFLLELAKLGQQHKAAGKPAEVQVGGQAVERDELVAGLRRETAKAAASAGQVCYLRAMDRQEARAARDASGLMLALTEFSSSVAPDDADRRALAVALLTHAGALLFSADEASLADADRLLARARKLLDALPPDPGLPALRAEYCRDHAWVKYYQRDAAAGAALCQEGLDALGEPPEDGAKEDETKARSRRALQSLHSLFLLGIGDNGDTKAALDAARRGVKTDAPISSNLLNLALCEDRAGLAGDALKSLRRAFEVALPDNPLGQDVVRILFVAAAFAEPRDARVALSLHAAAEALLDAQRTGLAATEVKLAFEEETHHLEVAQTLVGRLIDAGDYGGALEAADRSRARILLELLGAPSEGEAAPDDTMEDNKPGPAPALAEDPLIAFGTASAYVRRAAARALRAAGAPMPLDAATLVETVKISGRPALLLQPERGRLHLFCVLPEEQVIVATSPVPLDEIHAAMHTAQGALGVFALARAGGGQPEPEAIEDEDAALDGALDHLSAALIAPWTDLLAREGLLPLVLSPRGLTLVPYRELALVPFALLRAPSGRLLIEEAPLSQVPSIASLRALATRPRPAPRRCLVYGNPALDPRHGLEPLLGAAAEAQEVARLLVASGLVPPGFAARTGAEAAESAFRADSLDAGLVHLACHAVAREPAARSSLYLAPSATHDGLLLPHEIADGQLANALVFLSACQTGLGRPTADGVIGLGRAFLEAGALAVVLSLWEVVDAAALELAGHFYRAALGLDGPAAPAATALQRAMLATRDALRAGRLSDADGEVIEEHPAHWAPFMLLGEGGLPCAGCWRGSDKRDSIRPPRWRGLRERGEPPWTSP